MSKQGQYNYKGINAQAWAAMSLFLQYLRYTDFSYIQLEAPEFEDFNLVFSDGHKIICESKDWKREFDHSNLKKILSNILKKTTIGEKDEILIICTKLNDDLRRRVEHMKYGSQFLTFEFKKKGFSDQQIAILDKVRFWKVQQEDNHLIVYALFSELLDFWLPEDELECKADSILIKRIYEGSAKGKVYKREDIISEIDSIRKKASKYSGYFDDERVKTEVQLQNLIKAVDNNKAPEWAPHQLSALTSKPALMSFALDLIKDKKIDKLAGWSDLWELYKIYRFSFTLFRIFESNLHTKDNKRYILHFFKNNISEIRRFYQRDFFDIDVVKITKKVLEDDKNNKFIKDAFEIVKKLITEKRDGIFYLKAQRDSSWERGEIAKLLKEIYDKANSDLKNEIYRFIVKTYNLVEDNGRFSHYTPREIFAILKDWLLRDFKKRFIILKNDLSRQYEELYKKKFRFRRGFNGWELTGGITSFWGDNYIISDRHFIIYTMGPALNKYYEQSKNKEQAWKFIKKNCIFSEKQVNKNRPDFLNRSVISIILKRYKNNKKKISDEAFKILKEFILSKKGIPAKAELIYQEVATGNFSPDQKWKLVKVSLEKYKIPISPFVEKIVRDLIKVNHLKAKKTILNWMESKEYFKRFRFEIQVVQNIYAFLDVDFEFAVDLFKKFISNPIFIKEYDNFEAYDVAVLLHDIMQKEFENSGDIKISAGIINDLLNKKSLSPNEQVVACFSIFSHRGDDNADRKELLILAYDKIMKPFLDKFKGNAKQKSKEIVKFITQSNSREAFVQFASRLARNKEIDKALNIVQIFMNDPDPCLPGKGPEEPKNKHNEHKKIVEEGEVPAAITSVRGWCAWALMGCNVLAGRKYIDKIIKFTERLLKDENYYIRHMACFSLAQLMRNRLTVLPTNKNVLFLDPSGRRDGKTKGEDLKKALKKSREIEELAFWILKEFTNKKKYNDNVRKALFKTILRPFNYFRAMNQAQVAKFFKLVKQYPDDVIAEAVPLLIYFAEIRQNHYKRWRWKTQGLYDDLQPYDPKPFQEEIKKLIQKNNSKINRQFVYHFYQLVKTAPEQIKSDDILDYNTSFKISYYYLNLIAENYDHEAFRQIYLFIKENLVKKNRECTDLLIKCYLAEKEALEKEVKQGNVQEIYWWPFYSNGDILVQIEDDNKFLEAFNILVHYPEEVEIGQIDNAVQRLEKICKNRKIVEEIFEHLIRRNIRFVDFKQRWKKNCFKK